MSTAEQLKQEKVELTQRQVEIDRELAKLEQEPKKQATAQIAAYVTEAKDALEKAEALANKFKLYFTFDACDNSLEYSGTRGAWDNGWESSSINC